MKRKHTFTKVLPILAAGFLAAAVLITGTAGGLSSASAALGTPAYSSSDLFTDRDLAQTADLSGATAFTVADGEDIRITEAGTYVLGGTASDVTVYVEAGKDDKVQLVLQDLNLTNSDFPCIYVVSADKVFVTVSGDSSLAVTGTFRADGSTNTDGVIFASSDLTLNGTAALTIQSTDNGVVCKDDLRITGGTYIVTANSKAFEANDSIRILGGTFTIRAGTDGFHAENDEDNSKGFLYIGSGDITITCGDDPLDFVTGLIVKNAEITSSVAGTDSDD